jgi:hypothetical protein
MLLNGRRLGIQADAYVPYLNYDVTNQAGRGFSGPQIDSPRHQQQSVGGKYAWYSAEESSLLNPSQPYNVVFPSYALFNGNLLSTTYQAYSNQANIITAFTGPNNPTTLVLTVRDAASPNTIHLHLVDASGVSHDYDINHCSDPMSCGSVQNANVDYDFDTMRVFGTAWFRPGSANYGYDYSEIALDLHLKASNTYISYLIIHSSGSPSLPAYNDWSITTTTDSW